MFDEILATVGQVYLLHHWSEVIPSSKDWTWIGEEIFVVAFPIPPFGK